MSSQLSGFPAQHGFRSVYTNYGFDENTAKVVVRHYLASQGVFKMPKPQIASDQTIAAITCRIELFNGLSSFSVRPTPQQAIDSAWFLLARVLVVEAGYVVPKVIKEMCESYVADEAALAMATNVATAALSPLATGYNSDMDIPTLEEVAPNVCAAAPPPYRSREAPTGAKKEKRSDDGSHSSSAYEAPDAEVARSKGKISHFFQIKRFGVPSYMSDGAGFPDGEGFRATIAVPGYGSFTSTHRYPTRKLAESHAAYAAIRYILKKNPTLVFPSGM